MKRTLTMGMALAFALGCGGGGGPSGSYSELKGKFDNPTGDLGTDNAKSVAAALAEKNGQTPPTAGALSSALAVTGALDYRTDCSYDQSGTTVYTNCSCDEGGSITAVTDASAVDTNGGPCANEVDYDNCDLGDGAINGTAYLYLADCTNPQGGLCFQFTGTFNDEPAEVEYCLDENGEAWFLVEVGGGVFAVKGYYDIDTGDGDWYVKDKDGEWHCTAHGGTGSCEGPGGNTFEF